MLWRLRAPSIVRPWMRRRAGRPHLNRDPLGSSSRTPLHGRKAMKAFVVDRYKSKSAVRLGEMPEPEVRDDDVLVQVHAASLNHLDSKIRLGLTSKRGAQKARWSSR